MRYKPELGWFGNLERAFTELTKTNNKVFNTENRIAADEEINHIAFVALAETHVLDDNTATTHSDVFPKWEVGVTYKVGQMRVDPLNGRLYRCVQEHTATEGWNPSLTPALWSVIDVTHAGTQEDPIIAGRGMGYEEGKYYFDEEDNRLYRCTRSGTLHYLPHELIGQYFELA